MLLLGRRPTGLRNLRKLVRYVFHFPARVELGGVEETPGLNAVRMLNGSVYAVGDAGIVFRDGQALTCLPSLCNFFGEADGILVTGGQNGVLYDALTGAPLHTHHSPLNCCAAFQRDGATHLVVGSYTGEGLIFVRAGGALRHLQTIPIARAAPD